MKVFLIFFILHITTLGLCQNLISNGNFEEYYECINDYGEIGIAKGWFQQVGSSDYFNRCCMKTNFVGVPLNFKGYQEPLDGSAYAGLFLFYFDKRYEANGFYNREYLQTMFTSPLQVGKRYLVSFYYSLADSSEFYTNHFSVCFSNTKFLEKVKVTESVLKCENRVSRQINKSEAIDTENWNKIEFEYFANGGENYLSIGFFYDDLTKGSFKKVVKRNRFKHINASEKDAYYYIDSVLVVQTDKR